jgi:hypothetical protein
MWLTAVRVNETFFAAALRVLILQMIAFVRIIRIKFRKLVSRPKPAHEPRNRYRLPARLLCRRAPLGIISVELNGNVDDARAFFNRCGLFTLVEILGELKA